MQKLEDRGFLTIAQNNDTTDYLELAYAQALSIKISIPSARYAVLVDEPTLKKVTARHRRAFDHVIKFDLDMARDENWKLANEWQACYLTPFKETIKLESDVLITRDISHWWNLLRLRPVVVSLHCFDYLNQLVDHSAYRQVFRDNDLPDVYSGLMYFRYSKECYEFFNRVHEIYANWDSVSQLLVNCREIRPTTDLVIALAAHSLGPENYVIPTADFFRLTHMKSRINNWPDVKPWHELVFSEIDGNMIRVNAVNQLQPFHYHEKSWLTKSIVDQLEKTWTQV